MTAVAIHPLTLAGLLLGVVLLSSAYTFWRIFVRQERQLASQDGAARREFDCPRCGRRMAPGETFGALAWRGESAPAPGPLTIDYGLLPNTLNMSYRMRVNQGWRCESCRWVLIDHRALVRQSP